jgi:hypothetical protein
MIPFCADLDRQLEEKAEMQVIAQFLQPEEQEQLVTYHY